jgi:hypothetical protein
LTKTNRIKRVKNLLELSDTQTLWEFLYKESLEDRAVSYMQKFPRNEHHPFQDGTYNSSAGYVSEITEILGKKFKGKLIDIGSGDGFVLLTLGILYPDAEFVGYEINEDKINNAIKTAKKLGLQNVSFHKQDLERKDFKIPVSDYYYMYAPCGVVVTKKILKEIVKYPNAKILNSYGLTVYGDVSQVLPKGLKLKQQKYQINIYAR